MKTTRYLIIGGGMTADAAVQGIRNEDPEGSIVLVGAEPHKPYKRPPLSKKLWAGGDEQSIWKPTDELGAELVLGRRIVSLDLEAHRATDDAGDEYEFERVLLATGGQPRRIPADGSDEIVYFRTYDDFRHLRELAESNPHVVVIGGGFIGSEIAAALNQNGCQVTMVFPDPTIAARVFPPGLGEFVNTYYREKGVEVRTGETVVSIERNAEGFSVLTSQGKKLEADAVVAGLGIQPSVELAEQAGLATRDGILVDAFGRAGGRDDVYAAGDVARFPLAALGYEARVEHEDHALTHGKLVGGNMAGADKPYEHIPFFYSDLFDLGYEAIGDTDPRLKLVESWVEPNRKGVVAYVDDEGKPRGFLLWDVWDKVDAARELIKADEPIDEAKVAELL